MVWQSAGIGHMCFAIIYCQRSSCSCLVKKRCWQFAASVIKPGIKPSFVKVLDNEIISLLKLQGTLFTCQRLQRIKVKLQYQTTPGATSCSVGSTGCVSPLWSQDCNCVQLPRLSWCNAAIMPQAPEAYLNRTRHIFYYMNVVCVRGNVYEYFTQSSTLHSFINYQWQIVARKCDSFMFLCMSLYCMLF